jgi:hypothetical protein
MMVPQYKTVFPGRKLGVSMVPVRPSQIGGVFEQKSSCEENADQKAIIWLSGAMILRVALVNIGRRTVERRLARPWLWRVGCIGQHWAADSGGAT